MDGWFVVFKSEIQKEFKLVSNRKDAKYAEIVNIFLSFALRSLRLCGELKSSSKFMPSSALLSLSSMHEVLLL